MTGPDKLTHGNAISHELTSSVPQSRSRTTCNGIGMKRKRTKAKERKKSYRIVSFFLHMPQLFTEIGRENRSSLETRADRTIANRPRIARTSKGVADVPRRRGSRSFLRCSGLRARLGTPSATREIELLPPRIASSSSSSRCRLL